MGESFNEVATKYLDHYLACLQSAETHRTQALTGKTLKMLIAACPVPLKSTCKGFSGWHPVRSPLKRKIRGIF